MFFAHFFEEEFCDGRGRGSRSLCGEHATASFWREPRPSGGHASAGGRSRVLGFCVRGVCVLGMALVCSLLICSSGRGGLRATGSACRGGRSTGLACCGPAVHWLGVSRAGGPPKQDPALAGSPRNYCLQQHQNSASILRT